MTTMRSVRQVKLFKSGRNQAVRRPPAFELPGDEAIMRREGNHGGSRVRHLRQINSSPVLSG
jgi:hypothetical protein